MWWTKRGAERRQLKESSTPANDEAGRLRYVRSHPKPKHPNETIDVVRARCLALANEVEQQLNKDRQRREQNGNS